jgi:hypothetical protein
MGDVSKKLMDQFATNLNTMLDEQSDDATADPAPAPDTGDGDRDGDGDPSPVAPSEGGDRPAIRKIDGPAAEPIDMAGMAGPALLKRIVPAVLALLVIALLVRRRQ